MAEETSKLSESTKAAFSSVQSSGLVQHYVKPAYTFLWGKYGQSPTLVRWLIFGFVAMSAIPIGCFLGFMSLVTVGCLIIGGIAFAIVEGGFAMFGSAFLLPTLGVAFLISSGIGLVSLMVYAFYQTAWYVVNLFRSSAEGRQIERGEERLTDRARGKTAETSQRAFRT
ncbi:hypothetical protein EDD21DRAFT_402906 [Dissophora ornata]|nr:hypothetical protein EDD21DRAFT_402906 [Dissophora ornata]